MMTVGNVALYGEHFSPGYGYGYGFGQWLVDQDRNGQREKRKKKAGRHIQSYSQEAKNIAEQAMAAKYPDLSFKRSVSIGFRSVTAVVEIPLAFVGAGVGALLGTAKGGLSKCACYLMGKKSKPIGEYVRKYASFGYKSGSILGRIAAAPLAVVLTPALACSFYLGDLDTANSYKQDIAEQYTKDPAGVKRMLSDIKPDTSLPELIDVTLFNKIFGHRNPQEKRVDFVEV